MGLNISKGNMYGFVTHTWNAISGKCFHNCKYCYMKRWGDIGDVHLNEKELKRNLGSGNNIFVGSGTDMFSENIDKQWILRVLEHMEKYPGNSYLLQTKNPSRILEFIGHPVFVFDRAVVCTTIETNRNYPEIMGRSPKIEDRISAMRVLKEHNIRVFLTIEPIIDFDLDEMVKMVKSVMPGLVSIGANSKGVKLPEPHEDKVAALYEELKNITQVYLKQNISKIKSRREKDASRQE